MKLLSIGIVTAVVLTCHGITHTIHEKVSGFGLGHAAVARTPRVPLPPFGVVSVVAGIAIVSWIFSDLGASGSLARRGTRRSRRINQ